MCRKYIYVCTIFSLWTIVQTAVHLLFVIYGYYLNTCVIPATTGPSIFVYLTYFYTNKCRVPVLDGSGVVLITLERYFVKFTNLVYSPRSSTVDDIIKRILNHTELFPDESAESSRAVLFIILFITLDAVWIVTAVALLMGSCFGIRGKLALFFYGPWLILTVCISLFDVAASVQFSFDAVQMTNFSNWLKFVGFKQSTALQDLDTMNTSVLLPMAPALVFLALSSRFVIIWIINLVGLCFVIRATASAFRKTFDEQVKSKRRMLMDSPPNSSHLDLDSSAARIRNWQLFYGAIDTSSSSSGSYHSQSDKDMNSNSRESYKLNEKSHNELASFPSTSSNESREHYYYPYPDVDNVEVEGSEYMGELRSQKPWSYTHQIASDKTTPGNRHLVNSRSRHVTIAPYAVTYV